MDQQLIDYIKNQRSNGVEDEAIKQAIFGLELR